MPVRKGIRRQRGCRPPADSVSGRATRSFDRAAAATQPLRYQREWARDVACARTVAKFSNSQLPARSNSGFAFLTQNFSRRCGSRALVRRGFDFVSVEVMMRATWRSNPLTQPERMARPGVFCRTSKMSHGHSGHDSCVMSILGSPLQFEVGEIARGVTDVDVGSGVLLGRFSFIGEPMAAVLTHPRFNQNKLCTIRALFVCHAYRSHTWRRRASARPTAN